MAITQNGGRGIKGVEITSGGHTVSIPKALINPLYLRVATKVAQKDMHGNITNMSRGQKATYTTQIVEWFLGGMSPDRLDDNGHFAPAASGGKSGKGFKESADLDTSEAEKFMSLSPAERVKAVKTLSPTDKAMVMALGFDGIKALQEAMKG